MTIRQIKPTDHEAVLNIYKPYILSTHITFEYDVPSLEEFSKRIEITSTEYPWLVATNDEKIIGYAYGSKHRYREAYKWSAESTIYLSPEAHGKKIARPLYQTLFDILQLQGFINVYAGVGLPNEKSVGFHRAMGFNEIGDFKNIGYKLGNWHDVKWFELYLAEHGAQPPAPKLSKDIQSDPRLAEILHLANQ